MQDENFRDQVHSTRSSHRRISLGILAGISVVLITGTATAWWTWNTYKANHTPVSPTVANPTTSPATSPTVTPQPSTVATEQSVQLYWLKDTGTNLELVPSAIAVAASDQPDEILKATFNELFKGPDSPDVASTIPANTKLLNLSVQEDGIHVDLSKEFTSGGGSASMMGRLAQVLYTATSLDPDTKVWFSVEGQPLEVLGGEGVIIPQPMTRADFEQDFQL
jgi:spore germination protein GerM